MTAEYKKLGQNGDVESGVVLPFSDDPKTDFAQVPSAMAIERARYAQQPDDHLLFAILTTVFCCLPCGIVAIVKSVDVRNKWLTNDIVGATQSSRDAKRCSKCSLGFGVLFVCLWFGLMIAMAIHWVHLMQQLTPPAGQMDQLIQQAQLQAQQAHHDMGQQPFQ